MLIRHLNPLVIAIQQHRGTTLALLEGDESFSEQVNTLRQDISRRFEIIQQLNACLGLIAFETECDAARAKWETFISKRREEGVISNFDFHNALIERLIQVIWQIAEDANAFHPTRLSAKAAGIPPSMANDGGKATAMARDHHPVVQLVAKDIPLLIEDIAKARGLSVHMAVFGRRDPRQQAMLDDLLQTIGFKKERGRAIHRGLHKDTLKRLPALMETLLHEHKLDDLLLIIKDQIMVPDQITVDGHMLFRFATEIIEIYSAVIDQGLSMIQHNLDATLIG